MVSGLVTSPCDQLRIFSGEASWILMASKSAMLFPRSNGLERYKMPPHPELSASVQDLRPSAAAFGFRSSPPAALAVSSQLWGRRNFFAAGYRKHSLQLQFNKLQERRPPSDDRQLPSNL